MLKLGSRCGRLCCRKGVGIWNCKNQHELERHVLQHTKRPISIYPSVRLIISSGQLRTTCGAWLSTSRSIHLTSVFANNIKIVSVPPFADSISEGDIRWEKAVGDSVSEDEILCEIETDKTSIPVPSPGSGVIEERLVEDGSTVKPGMELCKIRITGESKKSAGSDHSPPTSKPAATAPPPTQAPIPPKEPAAPLQQQPPPPTSPPPRPAPPSKPMSTVPITAIKPQSLENARVKIPPADPTKEITGTRTEQRVKMNRMRLRIAERLKQAQNTNAMLTTFNEIDMSNVMELRKSHGENFVKIHGIKLGFMSPFVKASAYALMDQPVVNAVIDGQEIVYRDYVDISVAVATPKGLVVPVLRNVEVMSYADIEKGMAALGAKARDGALAIEDMDGGTFTISNGGVFGSLYGTPIINPPQSAILGMHAIVERPVARNGQVVIRPMMYVALTYDHRLIDGREAVTFLKKIKTAVEDPRSMLLEL